MINLILLLSLLMPNQANINRVLAIYPQRVNDDNYKL